MPRPHDDALSWDGDDDPTLDVGHDDAEQPPAARDADAEADPAGAVRGAETDEAATAAETPEMTEPGGEATAASGEAPAAEDEAPRPLGDVALVSLGVIGGIYALWTAGWVVGALRLHQVQGGDAMFLASMVLGIAAPAIWFLTAWVLTRHRASWMRFLALLGGIVVLVPWPFVMVGAIGQ